MGYSRCGGARLAFGVSVVPDCPRQIVEEQHVERDQKERVDGHIYAARTA